MRGKFLDAGKRVVVHAPEYVDEVFLWIYSEHAAVLRKGKHHGSAGTGILVADKEPVLCAELDGSRRGCCRCARVCEGSTRAVPRFVRAYS